MRPRQLRALLDCPNCGNVPHAGRTCTGRTTEEVTAQLVALGAKQYTLPDLPKKNRKGDLGW